MREMKDAEEKWILKMLSHTQSEFQKFFWLDWSGILAFEKKKNRINHLFTYKSAIRPPIIQT